MCIREGVELMSGCFDGKVGGIFTSTGTILVLFILLVIVSRCFC